MAKILFSPAELSCTTHPLSIPLQVLRCVASGDFDDVHVKMNQFWDSIAVHFKPLLKLQVGALCPLF